MTTVVLDIGQ